MMGRIFAVALALVFIIAWVVNAVKFAKCDFESPYKCEVVHALGLNPVVAPITAWIDSGK